MTNDRAMQFVSAAVDGELDADEQAELAQLFESSAEAREFKQDLEQLDSLLGGLPELAPPEPLHERIMAQAPSQAAQGKSSILSWLRLPPFGSGMRYALAGAGMRYALAATSGAIIAAIFLGSESLLPATTDISDLVGTMAPNSATADANTLDSFTFHGDELESLVRLERSNDNYLLDIQVEAAKPLDITVDMTSAGVHTDAIAQIDSKFESIAISNQTLQLRALGQQRLTILLRRVDDETFLEDASISLEFSSDGKLLQHGELRPTW